MKECTSCKQSKPFTEFYKASRRKDGYASQCKKCCDIKSENSRDKNPSVYQQHRQKSRAVAIDRFHTWKREQGCKCCDESEPYCLDLHHVDPTEKDAHPSALATGSWEKLMEEAAKCVIVCKNCHAKIHAGLMVIK